MRVPPRCSNPSGKIPSIILIPGTHTQKQPGNRFHICFLCDHISQPFTCFNKTNKKKTILNFAKWADKAPLKIPPLKRATQSEARLCTMSEITLGLAVLKKRKKEKKTWGTEPPPTLNECGFTSIKSLFLIHCMRANYGLLNILDPVCRSCTQSIRCHTLQPSTT